MYLVATPIGNLEDITLRALRVLREADVVACEDTRRTQQLLEHYEIRKRLVSYHEHNELTRAAELVIEMEAGAQVALVSDAGMPVISDPGHRLVNLCARHKVPVVPVPGASAAVAALAASGLASEEFLFVGFLPARKGERRRALERLAHEPRTIVVYEAPHRLRESLEDAREVLGNRHAVIAREVTKLHEEFLRGRIAELLEGMGKGEPRGEITLVIAAADEGSEQASDTAEISLEARVAELEREGKMGRKAALKQAARERGITRREAYKRIVGSKEKSG